MTVKIGVKFKPDPAFKTLIHVQLLLLLVVFLLLGAIITTPLLFIGGPASIIFTVFLCAYLLLLILTAIWVNLYYKSMFYTFTESEILVEKGVLWRHRNIIPYNRITNVDIRQGPMARLLRLWDIHIQTTGHHTYGGYGTAEAYLQGIRNAEEVKEFVMNMVRRPKPTAVEAEAEIPAPENVEQEILTELKKIREVLEGRSTNA